jgi:nucleotide-binding universal stress UspA family protein
VHTIPQAEVAIRNILFATDFSNCSQRALYHAIAVAHAYGSTLHVAHVVRPALFSMVPPEGYMGTAAAETLALELAREDAERAVAEAIRIAHCDDVKHRTWVRLGEVGDVVRGLIMDEHIDLAVVGTHGKTGLRKLVMGSVAEDVFRRAPCPVVTIGPQCGGANPQSPKLKHILFPTDLTPDSARALPITAAIAAKFGAKITLLHVVEHRNVEATCDRQRIVAALEAQMLEMAAIFAPVLPGTKAQVEFGDVGTAVLASAERLGTDLIAFGLKAPDTYVDRVPWMHAYKVACEAQCPVLSLRGESLND